MSKITNALTIDVEDYFQVSAFANDISYDSWDAQPSRVVANTQAILNIFDQFQVKGTFFVLGWVAKRFPDLVKEIHNQGHEVASHGYSHQLIYKQSPEVFRKETLESKQLLEDIIQAEVLGYRAASYSITRKSLWALDILVEAGFKYDSSIFPVRHDRYGIPGTPRYPYRLISPNGGQLIEYPISTKRIFNYQLPVAGGGYFRLFPYWFTRYALKSINKSERSPFVFYLHPWEVDPEQPRISSNWLSQFRHYNNLEKCDERLKKLISGFKFSTMNDVLQNSALEEFDISSIGEV